MTDTPETPIADAIAAVRDTIMAGERMRLDMPLSSLTEWNQNSLRAALDYLEDHERAVAGLAASAALPRLPWNVLWIGDFCYLVDADQRKIATLYGKQEQREAVAEAMVMAFGAHCCDGLREQPEAEPCRDD